MILKREKGKGVSFFLSIIMFLYETPIPHFFLLKKGIINPKNVEYEKVNISSETDERIS